MKKLLKKENAPPDLVHSLVHIAGESVTLEGELVLPENPQGWVLFAHGSGSSRHSPRNQFVAQKLQGAGIGTLLFDLLTPFEDADYRRRFDIPLLTQRLIMATQWLKANADLADLPVGYFGASTGAAAAFMAAADLGEKISCVVSRGGRPDLALDVLDQVKAPTLLIVGGLDEWVLDWNRQALERLASIKELKIVPGATHLFEEPGALEKVSQHAQDWFIKYLSPKSGKE